MWPFTRAPHRIDTAATAPAEARSLSDPDAWLFELFGATSATSGVTVSATTALRVPAVSAGVKAIAEAVAILPLHAYRRQADGSRERIADAPATLLNGDANPWTRGPQLRELLTSDAITFGNGLPTPCRGGMFRAGNHVDHRARQHQGD